MLDMQIKKLFEESYTKKFLGFLFADDFSLAYSDTYLGKLTEVINIPWLSSVFAMLSIGLFWYEGFFGRFLPAILGYSIPSFLLLSALIFADKSKIVFKKYHLWFLVFLLLLACSGVFAATGGLGFKMIVLGWFIMAQFFVALVLGQTVTKKDKSLEWLILGGIPFALVAIWQFLSGAKTPASWVSHFESATTRAFAFFTSPNVLGVLSACLALVAFAVFLKNKRSVFLASSAAYFLAMIFSLSREAWLGFFVGLVVFLLFWNKKILWFSPLALLLLGFSRFRNRLLAAFNQTYLLDSYLDGRIWSFINGWSLTLKRPILGFGPGSYGGLISASNASPVYLSGIQNGYTALYFADNQFIEILVQSGFLGLFSLLFFIISYAASLFRRQKDLIAAGVLAAFVCFWITGIFANVLEFGAISVPIAFIMGIAHE